MDGKLEKTLENHENIKLVARFVATIKKEVFDLILDGSLEL